MFLACKTYEKQLRIEKTRLSHQVWSHGGSTFKKKRTLNGHFSRPAQTDPYMYEVFKMLHALKLNVRLNHQNSKLCKNKKNFKPGGNPARQNLHHKFTTFPTNFYFRPIHIFDQILFQTYSYFRPIPFRPISISDQFLFPTNSYFRPCRL